MPVLEPRLRVATACSLVSLSFAMPRPEASCFRASSLALIWRPFCDTYSRRSRLHAKALSVVTLRNVRRYLNFVPDYNEIPQATCFEHSAKRIVSQVRWASMITTRAQGTASLHALRSKRRYLKAWLIVAALRLVRPSDSATVRCSGT